MSTEIKPAAQKYKEAKEKIYLLETKVDDLLAEISDVKDYAESQVRSAQAMKEEALTRESSIGSEIATRTKEMTLQLNSAVNKHEILKKINSKLTIDKQDLERDLSKARGKIVNLERSETNDTTKTMALILSIVINIVLITSAIGGG